MPRIHGWGAFSVLNSCVINSDMLRSVPNICFVSSFFYILLVHFHNHSPRAISSDLCAADFSSSLPLPQRLAQYGKTWIAGWGPANVPARGIGCMMRAKYCTATAPRWDATPRQYYLLSSFLCQCKSQMFSINSLGLRSPRISHTTA